MHLNDPARPQLNDRPCYLRPDGKVAAVIPPWTIYNVPGGRCCLSIYLMTSATVASQFELEFWPSEFEAYYESWKSDPEFFYQHRLGWTWKEKIPPPATQQKIQPRSTVTLADIGL